ncbi:MAG: hypothetical protein IKF51_08145 [Solobacterium sp.]|nr:hypothetical protein [Solobacterium sp.]
MSKRNYMKMKSIRIRKDESVLDAIENAMPKPHWIHHTKEDPHSVTGIYYLPECECSQCGFTVGFEKPVCPHCGAKMDTD